MHLAIGVARGAARRRGMGVVMGQRRTSQRCRLRTNGDASRTPPALRGISAVPPTPRRPQAGVHPGRLIVKLWSARLAPLRSG
jgi:hypothetical protein